jgi:hypothetical protein
MALNYWTNKPTNIPKVTENSYANLASATLGANAAANSPGASRPTYGGFMGAPTQKYGRSAAKSSYNDSIYRRNHGMQLSDLDRSYEAQRALLPEQMNQRGLLDSGVFDRNLGRTYGDQLRATGRLEMALQDLLTQSNFNMADYGRTYDEEVFGGLDDQATRRQQMALDIKGAMS